MGVQILTDLRAADRSRLARLCGGCTDFFELVEGQPGGATTAEEILGPLPAHVTTGTKRVFGIEQGERLVGVIEILQGFPAPDEWQIGLLLIAPELRGTGLGTKAWLATRDQIRQQGGKLVRLVVQQQNPAALRFWQKHGFTVERETVLTVGKLASSVWVLRLDLAESHPVPSTSDHPRISNRWSS